MPAKAPILITEKWLEVPCSVSKISPCQKDQATYGGAAELALAL